jgi:hypothetical protein
VTVGRHLGGAIEISLKVADFRNGSKAPFRLSASRFRSTPINGHRETGTVSPVRGQTRTSSRAIRKTALPPSTDMQRLLGQVR